MSTSLPLSGVQLGAVSVSGPHSVMEIGEIHLHEMPALITNKDTEQSLNTSQSNKDPSSSMNRLELPITGEPLEVMKNIEDTVSTVKRPPPLEVIHYFFSFERCVVF